MNHLITWMSYSEWKKSKLKGSWWGGLDIGKDKHGSWVYVRFIGIELSIYF